MNTDNEQKIWIDLASGRRLEIGRVMLFPEADVMEIISLRAKAQEEMGGVGSRLGFVGDPEWAIGGAIAAGVIGALASSAKAKKGLELLRQAAQKHEQLKAAGKMFDVSLIEGIANPAPSHWRAVSERKLDIRLAGMGWMERDAAIKKYNLSQIQGNLATVTTSEKSNFIIFEDEFILIESNEKVIAIRWNMVESYQTLSSKTQGDSDAMSEHGISFDGEFYKYKELNYRSLHEAITHAKSGK